MPLPIFNLNFATAKSVEQMREIRQKRAKSVSEFKEKFSRSSVTEGDIESIFYKKSQIGSI